MTRVPLFVELCAGLAAVSLGLQGGRYARPPVSRCGNKHGYLLPLLRIMGLRPGQGADRFLWCEPDPGCRALLHAYTDREVMEEAARIIRSWKDEEPRALWERLRAEGPIRVGEAREVARNVICNRWAFSQRQWWPAHPGYGGPGSKCGDFTGRDESIGCAKTAERMMEPPTLPATVTPDARAVDPREVARWAALQANTQKSGGFGEQTVGTGDSRRPMRMEDLAVRQAWGCTLPATVTPDARPIEPADLPPGTVAYLDGPYENTTGYGNDLPRAEQVALARRWADAGARVYVSEAEPIPALVADGWHTVEITSQRTGQKRTFGGTREWVTCSHEPAWRPAEQQGLFGALAPETG